MAKLASFFFFPKALAHALSRWAEITSFGPGLGWPRPFYTLLGHMDLTRPKHVQHPFISLLVIMVIINKQIGIVNFF